MDSCSGGAGFRELEANNLDMSRSLYMLVEESELPEGFIIRPLTEEDDLDAYDALYGFVGAVTREHRLELLHSPEYEMLVVFAPDSAMVAYCEISYSLEEWRRSEMKVAWIDYVRTAKDFLRRGMGKAVMLAGLQHMQAWGAEKAMLITMETNTTAQSTFRAVGFVDHELDV